MDDRLVFTDDRLISFFNFLLMQSISHGQVSRVELKDNQWREMNQTDVVLLQVGDEGMPVEELANRLAVPPGEVVKILFMKGIMVQVNQVRGPAACGTAPPHVALPALHSTLFVMSSLPCGRRRNPCRHETLLSLLHMPVSCWTVALCL